MSAAPVAVVRQLASYAAASVAMSLPWPLLLVLAWDRYGDGPHGPLVLGPDRRRADAALRPAVLGGRLARRPGPPGTTAGRHPRAPTRLPGRGRGRARRRPAGSRRRRRRARRRVRHPGVPRRRGVDPAPRGTGPPAGHRGPGHHRGRRLGGRPSRRRTAPAARDPTAGPARGRRPDGAGDSRSPRASRCRGRRPTGVPARPWRAMLPHRPRDSPRAGRPRRGRADQRRRPRPPPSPCSRSRTTSGARATRRSAWPPPGSVSAHWPRPLSGGSGSDAEPAACGARRPRRRRRRGSPCRRGPARRCRCSAVAGAVAVLVECAITETIQARRRRRAPGRRARVWRTR